MVSGFSLPHNEKLTDDTSGTWVKGFVMRNCDSGILIPSTGELELSVERVNNNNIIIIISLLHISTSR